MTNAWLTWTATALMAISPSIVHAVEADDLELAQTVTLPNLRGVTSVAVSNDGNFLYSAAYQADAVSIFKRDSGTGQLTAAGVLKGQDLRTAISIRVSADGKYAAVAQFTANKVTLFKPDAATGELTKFLDLSEGENAAQGLQTAIDTDFSRDDRFLYTASGGGVGVFQIEDDKLTFVQYEQGDDDLHGVRGCIASPDGRWVYAAAHESGTLGVFRRDEKTGKLDAVQILKDGENGIASLAGVFRIAVSADSKYLYVSAGRFDGDQAISAYEVQMDGRLKLLQQFINGADDFAEFEGGNSIRVSPDGKAVFAVASVSDRLFRFSRDAATGKLAFLTSQQAGTFAPPGAAGLCFSPDGKFVYIADEAENSIEVLKMP
jgi:6-phosphogluconolactonase (cycloisomerase 2 family)